VESIEQAAYLEDLARIWPLAVERVDHPPEATNEPRDLGVRPGHGDGRLRASQDAIQDRVELRALGCFVRGELLDEEAVDAIDVADRLGVGLRPEGIGGSSEPLQLRPEDLVLLDEAAGDVGVGRRDPHGNRTATSHT